MIRPGSGGQTRALLMRNRLFAQYGGVHPILLALDDSPNYPKFREVLRAQGQLVDPMRLLNIFEWYRDGDISYLPPLPDEKLAVVEGFDTVIDQHPDGTRYRTRYLKRFDAEPVLIDYHRCDGSVFLRVPAGGSGASSSATDVYLVNSLGQPVGRWPNQRGWRRNWILQLLEADRPAYLFCDSRFAIADIVPLRHPRLHILHVVHNVHLGGHRRWSSKLTPSYLPLFGAIHELDALVTLTERQRKDLADRFGATTNLFVVPNPIEPVESASPEPPRKRHHFVMLARLEPQKRIEDAIRTFALVVAQEPAAVLDLYGDGGQRAFLAQEIERLGLQNSVFLRGHDPHAADVLRSATAMLLTSRFEGYPLAVLESFSRGCPVLSYDIKYGPREQITPGTDGFLVTAGDLQALADQMVRLIRDPELVTRLSLGARRKAAQHGHRDLLANWRTVIEQVTQQKARRTKITSVSVEVTRLGYRQSKLPAGSSNDPELRTGISSSSAGFRVPPMVEFASTLSLAGRSKLSTAADAVLTLDAVSTATGTIRPLPLTVERTESAFQLSSSFDPAAVFAGADAASFRLRLRLIWANSSWETLLARPDRLAPDYELSYDAAGTLTLLRSERPSEESPVSESRRPRRWWRTR